MPRRPLHELRAVVVVFDPRFWDRSQRGGRQLLGRAPRAAETARLTQLFLGQKHPNTTAASRCLKVAPNTVPLAVDSRNHIRAVHINSHKGTGRAQAAAASRKGKERHLLCAEAVGLSAACALLSGGQCLCCVNL